MFIVYACYVNERQPTQTYPGLAESVVQDCFFKNIFIFYGCKVMFVLKETLESLISVAHELQELVQMGWINSPLHPSTQPPELTTRKERAQTERKGMTWHTMVLSLTFSPVRFHSHTVDHDSSEFIRVLLQFYIAKQHSEMIYLSTAIRSIQFNYMQIIVLGKDCYWIM